MSIKARVLNLLLALSAGAVVLSAVSMPAHAESRKTAGAEVRVVKSTIILKHIRYTAPQYPAAALQKQISGFVVVEFVINGKGEPTGLRVVDAQPGQVFERSVLKAVKRWRYSPLQVDNVVKETPTRTIVRFDTPT